MRTCSFASFALFCFAVCLLAWPQLALAQGPAQPEAMQFEPVDVTDVVNLATGDFAYTLPLLSVPGPEGDYPIAMSYHSGIGPNQEATWVGLGWTLNAGAINRTVTGYPDDYRGAQVETRYYSPEQVSRTYSVGVSVNIGYGSVGMNMAYNNHMGMLGPNISIGLSLPIRLQEVQGPVDIEAIALRPGVSDFIKGKRRMGISANVNIGETGLSGSVGAWRQNTGSVSVGKNGFSASAGRQIGRSTVGFSLSSHGIGANFSRDVGALGGMSMGGAGSVSDRGFSLSIPLGALNVNLGYSEHTWKLDELIEEEAFGYLHQQGYRDAGSPTKRKYERHVQGGYFYPAQDHYNVSAQGLSGAFSPYYPHAYVMIDAGGGNDDERAKLENDCGTANPIFRFLGDQGSNLISTPEGDFESYCDDFIYHQLNASEGRYGSKIIEPIFPDSAIYFGDSGHIGGFRITDIDGKIYEFLQPVFNLYSYTQTLNYENNAQNPDSNWTRMGTPYATQWLITGIKGADYVDRAPEGFGEEDWGYWVSFHYDSEMPHVWRSPDVGYTLSPMSKDVKSFSIGLRENYTLSRIETATHLAEFAVADSPDRSVPISREGILFEQVLTPDTSSSNIEFRFKGDLTPFLAYHDSLYNNDPAYQQNPSDILSATKEQCRMKVTGLVYHTVCSNVPINYHIDQIYNPSYDPVKNHTIIFVPGSTNYWNNGYKYAHFTSQLIPSGSYAQGKKLTIITLKAKNAPAESVKSVEFHYNYSLRPNSEGSSAQNGGSLTLMSIEAKGQNNMRISPPYRFEYTAQVDGFNPEWERDRWDNWGSFRAPDNLGGDTGSGKHLTPQEAIRAEQAIAWELRRISTPTGATVDIEYERDTYHYVNGDNIYDISHVLEFSEDSAQVVQNIDDIWSEAHDVVLDSNDHFCDVSGLGEFDAISPGDLVLFLRKKTQQKLNYAFLDYYHFVATAQVVGKSGNAVLEINKPLCNDQGYYNTSNSYMLDSLRIVTLKREVYGDKVRVSRIRTSIGSLSYETSYRYVDELGHPSGVTPSLPGVWGGQLKNSYQFYRRYYEFEDLFNTSHVSHRLGYGRPAPSVLYSRVEVMSTDLLGQAQNGKRVYEFYTAKDFPYQVDSHGGAFVFNDPSGIYGQPKRTTYWEQLSDSTYRIQRLEEPGYAFSAGVPNADSLLAFGQVVTSDNYWSSNTWAYPLGLIQETYFFCNDALSESNPCTTFQSAYQRSGERRYQNVFPVQSLTKEYVYQGTQVDSIITQARIFKWDALSGQALASASQVPNEERLRISRTTPAYWVYDGMQERNMLTQTYEQTEYLIPDKTLNDLTSVVFSSPLTDPNNAHIIASTVTTWRDWAAAGDTSATGEDVELWRQNDTYSYLRSLDYKPLTATWQSDTSHTYLLTPSYHVPWIKTANITAYDRFSRVRETVGADGSYATTIYGYDQEALVTAVVANARANEVVYASFEGEVSATSQAYTGRRAAGSSDTEINSAVQDLVPDQPPSQGGQYLVELWAKPYGGYLYLYAGATAVDTLTTSGWQLVRFTVSAGTEITVAGGGWVDDVRVYPEQARMSSFVYDPVTWKVVAMTDTNNRSTFYEYDDAGRLVAVRDHDRQLVSTHTYRYGRNASP